MDKPNEPLYCCPPMEHFMASHKNLSDSLQIKPRVILFPHKLQLRHTYKRNIEIKNNAMYPRSLNYTTNCDDITLNIYPSYLRKQFLNVEEVVYLEITLKPIHSKFLNISRYVYVDSSHPNVRFEIPILVRKSATCLGLPNKIIFLPICPKNSTYYEMIIYNKGKEQLSQIFNTSSPQCTVLRSTKQKIQPNTYTKVLIELKVHHKTSLYGLFKIKLGQDPYILIPYEHITVPLSVHIEPHVLKFSVLKFNQKEIQTINVCNVSNYTLKHEIALIPPESMLTVFNMEKEKNVDASSYKHFSFFVNSQHLKSNATTKFHVTFHPIQHDDLYIPEFEESPFSVLSGLKITLSIDNEIAESNKKIPPPLNIFIKLDGLITGPIIDILPKSIDISTVYFGEEHCVNIKVKNIDGLNKLRVKPLEYKQTEVANVIVTPNETVMLTPCQSVQFTVQFYATTLGMFRIKLDFKVINGDLFSTLIRGQAEKPKCRVFPNEICLGEIPIAIPQRREITLINPLSVPITIQCNLEDEDGSETPLVLNACRINENLPIHVLDPTQHLQRCLAEEQEENNNNEQTEYEIIEGDDDQTASINSVHSIKDDDATSYSTNFEDFMLKEIPEMVRDFLTKIKRNKYSQKSDCELLIIDEALNCLLKHNYFHGMDKNKNYMHMDWNALSNDPKEVFVPNQIIYLQPATSKLISIIVIPNRMGFQQHFINIRVCPEKMPKCYEHEPEGLRRIIKSDYMITKLPLEFICTVPNIQWNRNIKIQEKVYPGEWCKFDMVFNNPDNVAAFFFYSMVPKSSQGEMKFVNDKWKYFIEPNSEVRVPCMVEFKTIGHVVIPGLLHVLGMPVGHNFSLEAHVLPICLRYEPQSITKRIQVLTNHRVYVYIHNVTPTTTWFGVDVKNEFINVYPNGGQLHPTGQITYVTLNMFFYDPGIYHTNVDIYMQYESKMKIPVVITVFKMPIIFEPELRSEDLQFQNILCTTEDEFKNGVICLQKRIKIMNRGKKSYRIVIKKKKLSETTTCSIKSKIQGYITIQPLIIVMQPESEKYFDIIMSACEECYIYHEYWIQIYDLIDPKRVENSRFVIKTTFIYPKIVWNQNEIRFNYYRTHKYKDHPHWELVYLTNVADNILNTVTLKVGCPFRIKNLYEDQSKKELTFSMDNLERKEIFVILDKNIVQERNLTDLDTRILCIANNRIQKPLHLKLKVFTPQLLLLNHNITLFAQEAEAVTYITLVNQKPLKAIYKWKKLQEEWHYISEEENIEQTVGILLSDILDTICFEDIPKPDSKTNMTQYYQTYRCYFKKWSNIKDTDVINVRDILYDIINELDIERKRYQLDNKSSQSSQKNFDCGRKIETETENERDIEIHCHEERQWDGGVSQDINSNYGQYGPTVLCNKSKNVQYYTKDFNDKDVKCIQQICTMFANVKQQQEQTEEIMLRRNSRDSSDEDNENMQKILYFNQQFKIDQSSTNTINYETSKECCIYYTINHIVDHLKLEDSYTLSLPSTDTCETLHSIYFLKKSGMLDKEQKEICILHLPPVKKGYEVKASFQLDILGGQSLPFNITLVNLGNTLKIIKDNVYVGMKPWYEKFTCQFTIENITNYTLQLKLYKILSLYYNDLPKIATGYIKFLNDGVLNLPAKETIIFKIEGILGFKEEFLQRLNIIINDSDEKQLRIKGIGIMPMIGPFKYSLPFIEQETQSIIEDYQLLQKIYYFSIFSNIIEQNNNDDYGHLDEEYQKQQIDENDNDNITVSTLSIETSSNTSKIREKEERFFLLMKAYVLVNNNEDLPNAKVLQQLLETEKFLNKLRSNREACNHLRTIYRNYEKSKQMFSPNQVVNLKNFMIQPLPFELQGVILNLGTIFLNELRKFKLNLEFCGPGKLIASARTTLKIPCLVVDFEIPENTRNKDFTYYQADDNQLCLPKRYRNLNERLIDAQTKSKVKQPHNYDLDRCKRTHQRVTNVYERKCINEHYNSLNKSLYAEQKHHVIHCKIFTNYKYNFSDTKLNVVILFKPEVKYYKHEQKIEDYLYIDLHMGPTLPILLRGTVVDRNREESSEADN